MSLSGFVRTGALGALAAALLATGLPAQAQERGEWRQGRAHVERSEDMARSPRQSAAPHQDGGPRSWQASRPQRAAVPSAPPPAAMAPPPRNSSYAAPRDRSYGAVPRGGGWQGEQTGQVAAAPTSQGRQHDASRRENGREARRDWNRAPRQDSAHSGWQRRDNRDRERHRDWSQTRRDQARGHGYANGYGQGYRDGHRADNRHGQDHRRWDNRGWRHDRRYDWYRHRAANRSIFRLGSYYAPYRGYSYSRIGIGIRLGAPFYSNRYWINDPWQYRLPPAYGPYRWVRYYDDALLVDIYSGQVVDVIYDFFW